MKLRLTLDVDYILNGTDPQDLKDMLRAIALNAVLNGMLSDDTDAEVEDWTSNVEELK